MIYDANREAAKLCYETGGLNETMCIHARTGFACDECIAPALASAYRAGAEEARAEVRAVATKWEAHARSLLCLDGPESDRLFMCAAELRQRFPCQCGHCVGRAECR